MMYVLNKSDKFGASREALSTQQYHHWWLIEMKLEVIRLIHDGPCELLRFLDIIFCFGL